LNRTIADRVATLKQDFLVAQFKDKGKQVIDERCSCKHNRSVHGDTLAVGHGGCLMCACAKFTWTGWVVVEDRKERK
jgi:hypothetical protein